MKFVQLLEKCYCMRMGNNLSFLRNKMAAAAILKNRKFATETTIFVIFYQ